ncbi:MAG: hypothetical protein WB992_13205 [Bryobacteraceae bacterium]
MSISFSLEQGWRVVLFVLGCLIVAAALIHETIVVAGSRELDQLGSAAKVQRAATLWPTNPEARYQIGALRLYTFGQTDAADAVKQMRKATELSPLRAVYWRGLAWACESASDRICANQATDRVRVLAPMDPEAAWFVGNYYLRAGRPELALERFASLLHSTPSYDKYVFRMCDSLGCPQAPAKRLFTGSGPQVELDYISYLATRGDVDTARELWKNFSADAKEHGFTFQLGSIEPLVDALLQRGSGSEARAVWDSLEKLKVVTRDQNANGNLVFNGGFEQPTSNSGLDWRLPENHYALIDMAAGTAYQGMRCMRVDFTISRNDSYFLAYQLVPVDRNTRYRLTAYVRSEGITSDSGPQLGVVDPLCPTCLKAVSEGTTGTTPWHRLEVRFSTGDKTELARVQVWRSPSRTYPMDITGVFWLDEVTLTPEGTSGAGESDHVRSSTALSN